MKKLAFYRLESVDELARPQETIEYTLDSPATDFFTDFKEIQPYVVGEHLPAVEAKELMRESHVRMKLVVDKQHRFVGIIDAENLIDRLIVKEVSNGTQRHQVSVGQLMIPKKNLQAFDIEDIKKSTVRDVIIALKDRGEQHCLVSDREHHEIRGVISASDISRKLHLPIDIQKTSNFYSVFAKAGMSA